jgi:hypothetical protein
MICAGNFLPVCLYDVDPGLSTVSCHAIVYFRILCADAAKRFNKRKSNSETNSFICRTRKLD